MRAHPLLVEDPTCHLVSASLGHAVGNDCHQWFNQRHQWIHRNQCQRVHDVPVPARNHQRIVLNHIVGVSGDGIHIHPGSPHRHRIVRPDDGWQIHILDVVDDIPVRHRVCVPGQIEVVSCVDVVPVEDIPGVEIGHDQIQIVDQFCAGHRITRGIGPNEGEPQRCGQRLVVHLHLEGERLPGCESVRGGLVKGQHGTGLQIPV